MKASLVSAVIGLVSILSPTFAQPAAGEKPDRTALARAAQADPNNVAAWKAYAEFLDRYGDPGAREAYNKLLAAARNSGDTAVSASVEHRLKLYNLLAGDGGMHASAAKDWPNTTVPGPIRSFARMAALSPDASPEDILPALARNVVTNGYQASHNNRS